METTASEKRRFARLDIALTVSYRVVDQGGEMSELAEAMSSDISAGGIRLMTPSKLSNGAKLELEVLLGEEENPIHVAGEVVWQEQISSSSFETGVSLMHMADRDKSRFLNFIFEQMSDLVGLQKGPETAN